MDNKEMLFFVEAVANEKGLDRADVFEALEFALATAIRKLQKEEMDVRVEMNKDTGEYQAYQCWTVVDDEDEEFDPDTMMLLASAQLDDPEIVIGDVLESPLETPDIGRIGAQTARHVIMQKLREASRRKVVTEFEHRLGEIFLCTVKRIEKGNIILDIGENLEGIMHRDQTIPSEHYRINARIRAYLYEIDGEARGPQLFFSRCHANFLGQLFHTEVPEISDGIIDIKGIVREPGIRAKIAVHTGDPHMDVIGACVGMRGSRVQSIITELNGERIDIIAWNSNLAEFVINAMAPAEIVSLSIDEENESIDISVKDDMLSQAIGKNGQNIRLASDLTGWELNVMPESESQEREEQKQTETIDLLQSTLKLSLEEAQTLIRSGMNSIEEVAYLPKQELLSIKGLSAERIQEIQEKANDVLLLQMLDSTE